MHLSFVHVGEVALAVRVESSDERLLSKTRILHYLCVDHITPGFEPLLIFNPHSLSLPGRQIVRSFKLAECLSGFNSLLREKNCALTSATAVVNAAINAGSQERGGAT